MFMAINFDVQILAQSLYEHISWMGRIRSECKENQDRKDALFKLGKSLPFSPSFLGQHTQNEALAFIVVKST